MPTIVRGSGLAQRYFSIALSRDTVLDYSIYGVGVRGNLCDPLKP